MKKNVRNIIIATALSVSLIGCSWVNASSTGFGEGINGLMSVAEKAFSFFKPNNNGMQQQSNMQRNNQNTVISSAENVSLDTIINTADIFTNRDLTQQTDTSSAKNITVADSQTIDITEEGVYVISGSAKNCTIKVNADEAAKVQLVLDGVSITNDSFPAIYVVSADKCFITSTSAKNTLAVTGEFTADSDTNTDAVIFSKDDIIFNGTGTIEITSSYGNGISGKDDVKFTGGTYNITSTEDAIEAKDSIAVSAGDFTINTEKDALHSENEDEQTKGYIYISGGAFDITSKSDAIQGNTAVKIDGGTFNITASEGIESTYLQINDGTITISASDDGINATTKSTAFAVPTVEINGGSLNITMGAGDTDAIDANGNIIINGGQIDITAQVSSFDYDGTAEFNGGTIIINGTAVDQIPQSMMPGGRGGFGGGRGFGGQMPENFNGQMPDNFNGQMPENFNGQVPDNFEQMPKGFSGKMQNGYGRGGRQGFVNENTTETSTVTA